MHDEIKQVLEKITYNEHKWPICVDLKMVNCLLGQQSENTKYPCFIYMWVVGIELTITSRNDGKSDNN